MNSIEPDAGAGVLVVVVVVGVGVVVVVVVVVGVVVVVPPLIALVHVESADCAQIGFPVLSFGATCTTMYAPTSADVKAYDLLFVPTFGHELYVLSLHRCHA